MTPMHNLTDEELVQIQFALGMLIELYENPVEKWLLGLMLKSVDKQISRRELGAVEFNLSLKWVEEEPQPAELPQISTFTRLPSCDSDEVGVPSVFFDFINRIEIDLPERNS